VPLVTTAGRDFWPMEVVVAAGDNSVMTEENKISRLWLNAAVVTWVTVTAMAVYLAYENGGSLAAAIPLAAGIAVVNLISMLCAGWGGCAGRYARFALAVQLASALALGYVLPLSFMPIYTIIWISMAINRYPIRTVWFLFGGVMIAWYLIMRFTWGGDAVSDALINVALYGTFHLFAMLSAWNASEAERARDRLAAVNRELVATQHLLSEAARQGERVRIGRDLHDVLGHHLAVLSIRLQTAERKTSGESNAIVAECRAIARLLLSDVRGAVDTLRNDHGVDVVTAIKILAEGAPGLEVHVDIDSNLRIDDVDIAESIVRCVQEALTNTLRHAGARNCWIRLSIVDDSVRLDVHDDGHADKHQKEGNGLRGMRERLAAVDGNLEIGSIDGAVQLHVEIPVPGVQSWPLA